MLGSKAGMVVLDISARLADDLKVADDGVLCPDVPQKTRFGHILHVVMNSLNGLKNMIEVATNTKLVRLAHIDFASDRTRSRKLSGRDLGVSTSTGTPSSFCKW